MNRVPSRNQPTFIWGEFTGTPVEGGGGWPIPRGAMPDGGPPDIGAPGITGVGMSGGRPGMSGGPRPGMRGRLFMSGEFYFFL